MDMERVEILVEERVEIWTPQWKGPIEGWAVNHINRNLWKVAPERDFDDLYQDAYIFFLICVERYPHVVEAPHFMSLFQTCLRNHIIDMAAKRTKQGQIWSGGSIDEVEGMLTAGRIDEVEAMELLEDAVGPLARVVEQLVLSEQRPAFRRNGSRETTRQYLCRIAGVPEDYPIVERLMNFIKGEDVCVLPRPVGSASAAATE